MTEGAKFLDDDPRHLTNRVRTFLRDWPSVDVLTAVSSSTGVLTATVADVRIFGANGVVHGGIAISVFGADAKDGKP